MALNRNPDSYHLLRTSAFHSFVISVAVASILSIAGAQEKSWQVTAAGGVAFLQMENVNATLEMTVKNWNSATNAVPVKEFDPIKVVPAVSVMGVYRYDLDMAVSLSARYWTKPVTNAYVDQSTTLNLDRSLRAVQADAGLLYYFPTLLRRIDSYAGAEVGIIWAHTVANTFNTRQVKNGAVYETMIVYDTRADYATSRLTVGLVAGATTRVVGPLLVRIEAEYTHANIGRLDGEVSRLEGSTTEPSSTEFNFSSFRLMAGLSMEL